MVSAYPFTISAWVRTKSVAAGNKAIVNIASGGATNIYYGIMLNGANASLVAMNGGTERINNGSTTTLLANAWYHVVGIFTNATTRTLYVDTVSQTL